MRRVWSSRATATRRMLLFSFRADQSITILSLAGIQHVLVQLLHDFEHESEALHEAIDGNSQHAIRGGYIFDPQDVLLGIDFVGWCDCGQCASYQR